MHKQDYHHGVPLRISYSGIPHSHTRARYIGDRASWEELDGPAACVGKEGGDTVDSIQNLWVPFPLLHLVFPVILYIQGGGEAINRLRIPESVPTCGRCSIVP